MLNLAIELCSLALIDYKIKFYQQDKSRECNMQELKILDTESTTCILCGDELESLKEPHDAICDFCGKKARISHECKSSHYLCDSCLAMNAVEYVKAACLKYNGTDPLALAVEIMNSPVIKMHGSEHHYLVPAVLLTCTHNLQHSKEDLQSKLNIAERRAFAETSISCTHKDGTCGAAMGTGVYVSMILGRELEHEDEWSPANKIIAQSLKRIAERDLPRCCKRDTYMSLEESIDFLRDNFAIDLPKTSGKCTFSLRNKTCGHEICPYFSLSNQLV